MRVEVELRGDSVNAVQESHSPGHPQRQSEGLGSVHHHLVPTLLVEQPEQRALWHPLADHHEPWGRVAATNHRQHVRVREDPADQSEKRLL